MKIFEITVVLFSLVLACQAGYHAPYYNSYYGKGMSHFSYPHYGFGSLGIPRTVYGYGRYGGYGYGRYGGYGGFGGFSGFGGYPFFGWGSFDDFDFFD